MKHQNELLRWAARWHYPFLRMPDGKHIKHGLPAWKSFVGERSAKRTMLAWQQVHRWQELANEERSA